MYHKEMLKILNELESNGEVPRILLHTCCAPCSTAVLEYLANYFYVTVYYYNPNIEPEEEYQKRKEEQINLLKIYPAKYPINFLDCDYDNSVYKEAIQGLELEKEGGKRCYSCYTLRLKSTALKAKELGFDYFASSLSVSPYKNANWLNEIGKKLSEEIGIKYLPNDFKKNNGYLKSIEYSKRQE